MSGSTSQIRAGSPSMAIPVAAKLGAKALSSLVKGIASSASGDGAEAKNSAGKIAVIGISALLICALAFVTAPFELFGAISNASKGVYGDKLPDGSYIITEVDAEGNYTFDESQVSISAKAISHYKREAKRLDSFARGKWSTGNGDIYSLPDWRWLWALDTVLTENDYTKVQRDKDTYERFHEGVLKAKSSTRIEERGTKSYEGVTAETSGAQWDEVAQAYYTGEIEYIEVSFWNVSYKTFDRIFISGSRGITNELSYFTEYESGGNYGGGWGDAGAALGAYQFDYRYGLSEFLRFCYDFDQAHYGSFAPWLNGVSRGDPGLESAWIAAYETYPEEFTKLQDQFGYENYYLEAEKIMEEIGVSLSDRRDCIKGLVWGITNLFGSGGARNGLKDLGLHDGMSDEELARTICDALANCTDFVTHWLKGSNAYAEGWSRRYANELETVLLYLAQSPQTGGESTTPGNGGQLDPQTKKLCANNYLASVRYIDSRGSDLILRYDSLVKHLSWGTQGQQGASDIIAKAEEFLGYPYVWGGQDPSTSFDCSGFVWYVLHSTGYFSGSRLTTDGFYDICEKISEDEAQPGDLVFFTGTYGPSDYVSHIGIYVGDGMMIHTGGAPGVCYASIYDLGTSGPLFGRLPT